MTENHKQKGVLERVFAVSPKGKGLLAASCIASVLGMVLSLVPYLSVYFICKYFLLGAARGHGGIVLWTAVAGEGCSMLSGGEKIISEYENYKKSMIYEYVTGKKRVDIDEGDLN